MEEVLAELSLSRQECPRENAAFGDDDWLRLATQYGDARSSWPRFGNLLDVIQFLAWQVALVLVRLQDWHDGALNHSTSLQHGEMPVDEDVVKGQIAPMLKYIRRQCEGIELSAAVIDRIEQFETVCRIRHLTYAEWATQARFLREAIEAELKFRRFAFIPTERAAKLDRIDIDWEPVIAKFSRARTEIQLAVECYALDCNTASVFHSMRVAEHGLRGLAWKLGLKRIGKQQHPLEFAEWGLILSALRGKLNALQQSPGRNVRKAASTKFYADAASQGDYLNEIWRKEVSHARGAYNAAEALNALTRTQAFMILLAQRVRQGP